MADLLTICQDVADEVGVERPLSIINNSDDTAKRLLQVAQRTGKELAKKHSWTALQAEHTFTTATSTSSYSLPSDFDRMIPWTQWDRTNEWRLYGPLSPQDWQFEKSGVAEEGPRRDYRIKLNSGTLEFFISPTPDAGSAGETLAFEYVSTNWCEDKNGNGQSQFKADTDTVRLDDELFRLGVMWRFRRTLGMAYDDEYREYMHLYNVRKANDLDMPRLRLNSSPSDELPLGANIQDANFPSS